MRLVVVLFVLFALVSPVFVLRVEASDVEDEAVSAVEGTKEAVAEAYGAVCEAERAGANVSWLLTRLDVAGAYLALARVCLRTGNFEGALGNAASCVGALDGVVDEAEGLRDRSASESREHSWMAMSGSSVGVVAVVCGCWLGWKWAKKRYHKQALGMRPEVVESES